MQTSLQVGDEHGVTCSVLHEQLAPIHRCIEEEALVMNLELGVRFSNPIHIVIDWLQAVLESE